MIAEIVRLLELANLTHGGKEKMGDVHLLELVE